VNIIGTIGLFVLSFVLWRIAEAHELRRAVRDAEQKRSSGARGQADAMSGLNLESLVSASGRGHGLPRVVVRWRMGVARSR
jgi:hypothetical protein